LNVSLYPLQFPDESWLDTYRSLPANVEVLLGRGSKGLAEFLRQRRGFYDTVMVSRIHNMRFVNELLSREPDLLDGARLIYDAEAITAMREIMQSELQGNALSEDEKRGLVEEEIQAARTADTIVTVSAREAAVYAQRGYPNTVVLGHSLVANPSPASFGERNGLLFVGALRDEDSPNVDSLHWFVNQVWPLVKAGESGIMLHVVGDNDAVSLQQLDSDRIQFHGRIDNLDAIYNSVRVFIAPTRFAAGIPHKIHEAAARGVPCAATGLLAEQLGWQHDSQLLAGDTPREFADNCLALYRDAARWNRIRSSALESVSRECSADAFKSGLLQLFE
jgi:glycosyltransferase involved in cell wall biosynthesis